MTILAVAAALALLVLISVVAGLVGFAALGALRLLEGGPGVQLARVVNDRTDQPARRTTSSLVDTTCRPGSTRL